MNPVIGKALDFGKSLLFYFSADERRKRRNLSYSASVKKAINLQEEHYDRLIEFLSFVRLKAKFKNPDDKKKFSKLAYRLKKDGRIFKRLT